MIDFDAAVRIVLENVGPGPVERRRISSSLGLALARPVKARFRLPRTDQSAMDGIAVRCADVVSASPDRPAQLRLTGEIPAGSNTMPTLRKGCAVKVFTGSALPRNCEAVVMVEYCSFEGDQVHVRRAASVGEHIRRAGEEVRRGDEMLPAGTIVTPPVVGLLSMFGREAVSVHRPPIVSVITMGDEVVAVGQPLSPVQIHDANGPAVEAALRGLGVEKVRRRLVGDRPSQLRRALASALRGSDLVITVGGASVGDHDHVQETRKVLGIRELFARVAMKPGKPNVFGLSPEGVPVFSLPGNPVSALVSFQHFVRPAVNALMNRPAESETWVTRGRLAGAHRKIPGRREFIRGWAQVEGDWTVARANAAQGSHMLTGLAKANVLIDLGAATADFAKGSTVRLRRLNWLERA